MPDSLAADAGRMVIAFAVVAAAVGPATLALRAARGYRRPAWRPWRTGWTGFDLLAVAFVALFVPTLGIAVIDAAAWFGKSPPPLALIALLGGPGGEAAGQAGRDRDFLRTAAAGAVALPCVVLAIGFFARTAESPRSRRLFDDTLFGVAAWAVLAPATFAVHFAANAIFSAAGGTPDDHPLTRVGVGRDVGLTIAFFASVCVVVPLIEELLFRRAVVPWATVRRRGDRYRPWLLVALAAVAAVGQSATPERPLPLGPLGFGVVAVVGLGVVLQLKQWWKRFPTRTAAAVYASAALFAAMHSAVWPSPVPLVVLGIGLGWLVARTRGVVSAAVCHGLFNAVSATFLLLRGPG